MTSPEADLQRLLELYRDGIGDIDETLSSADVMWDGNEAHYRGVGESAVRCIRVALLQADRHPTSVRDVLDFGCGHGRVLRYMQKLLPHASFTATDLDPDAVKFCADSFGANPVQGAFDPADAEFPSQYDLIWVGSVLTHIDADRWPRFLALWTSLLRDGGIVIFTTQGRSTVTRIEKGWPLFEQLEQHVELVERYERDGFGYLDYGAAGYGVSLARPEWVISQLRGFPDLELLGYREHGWDDAQDVVTCRKFAYSSPTGPQYEAIRGRFES